MKIALSILASAMAAFIKGADYNVKCQDDGIHVTSSTCSFYLTDKGKSDDPNCHETAHWNAYGGSIFLPKCLNIKEEFKFWNGIIITRKEGPRSWKSETLFIECFTDGRKNL